MSDPDNSVTLVITSCGRWELLIKTIQSFLAFNTYPITKCIVIDDSGYQQSIEFLRSILRMPTLIIQNIINLGQVPSVDIAYSLVDTKYIFHCEDDWEFFDYSFIEDSMDILEKYPEICHVSLRAHDNNGHPHEPDLIDDKFHYLESEYLGIWSGFTFNPGLRRLSDYLKFKPYYRLNEVTPYTKKGGIAEMDIAIHYFKAGYRGVITKKVDGYVKHTGEGRHIPASWE